LVTHSRERIFEKGKTLKKERIHSYRRNGIGQTIRQSDLRHELMLRGGKKKEKKEEEEEKKAIAERKRSVGIHSRITCGKNEIRAAFGESGARAV
jgi:hypothetical protein